MVPRQGFLRQLFIEPASAPWLAQNLELGNLMVLRVAEKCTDGKVWTSDVWEQLLKGLDEVEVQQAIGRIRLMCATSPNPPRV